MNKKIQKAIETNIKNYSDVFSTLSNNENFENLVLSFLNTIEKKGRIIFVTNGLISSFVKSLIEESYLRFGIERERFILLSDFSINEQENNRGIEDSIAFLLLNFEQIELSKKDLVISLSFSKNNKNTKDLIKYFSKRNDVNFHIVSAHDYEKDILFINIPILESNLYSFIVPFIDLLFFSSMSLAGRVFEEKYLIFQRPISTKLINNAEDMISHLTGINDRELISKIFVKSGYQTELVLLMLLDDITLPMAKSLLNKNQRALVEKLNKAKCI